MSKSVSLLQISLVLGLALGASGCSTLNYLNPFADDTPPPASQFPDAAAPTASDADAGTTPDLAGIPSKPVTSSAADRQAQAQALAADGAQAQYSADALRGGTEAAAPTPGASDAPPTAQAALTAPPTASDAAPTASDTAPTAMPTPAPAAVASSALNAGTEASSAAPASPDAAVASAAPPPAPVRTASVAPQAAPALPPGTEPAVPANTPIRGVTGASAVMSDAALGFQPSSAPPLSPTIGQWVSAPIVARYQQTASNAGISRSSDAAVPAVPVKDGAVNTGMGGPDMSGAVVANLDAISGGSVIPASLGGGDAPTAVVYFPGDGTSLSAAARSEIRGAVAAFKANGGQGSIRVVGHASSRTANMPVEKHLETIFNKSQARANVVAQELIHQGVPAARVQIEAVGDSQPVYYESMPKGEDGNRRAEIFVQS